MKINDLRKINLKEKLIEYTYLIIGIFLMGFCTDAFLVPSKLAPGGISGVANIVYYLFGLEVNRGIFLLNIPLFIGAFVFIGFEFGIKSLVVNGGILFTGEIFRDFQSGFSDDVVVNGITFGFLAGTAVGFTIKAGANTGGTDILAIILNKFFKFLSVAKWLFVLDGIIIFAYLLVFKDFNLAIYSILSLYIGIKIVDAILIGSNPHVVISITSSYNELLKEVIFENYKIYPSIYEDHITKDTTNKVLEYILHKKKIEQIKLLILSQDSNALIVLSNIHDIIGLEKYRKKINDLNANNLNIEK